MFAVWQKVDRVYYPSIAHILGEHSSNTIMVMFSTPISASIIAEVAQNQHIVVFVSSSSRPLMLAHFQQVTDMTSGWERGMNERSERV